MSPRQVSTSSHQQIRQLALPKQLITPQRKLTAQATQLAQVAGKRVPTQLSAVQIVQGQKQLPTTVTVQQIQQVMGRDVIKVPAAAAAGTSGARASPQQLQARVLPSSHHPIKQTIQVVSAGSPFASGGATGTLARPIATLQQGRPTAVQLVQPTSQSSGGQTAAAAATATSQQQQQQQNNPQLQQVRLISVPETELVRVPVNKPWPDYCSGCGSILRDRETTFVKTHLSALLSDWWILTLVTLRLSFLFILIRVIFISKPVHVLLNANYVIKCRLFNIQTMQCLRRDVRFTPTESVRVFPQTATVALTQLKPLVSAAAAAVSASGGGGAGSPSALRGSPYTMRLRTVSSTASTPDRPSPASTPPQPPPGDPAA